MRTLLGLTAVTLVLACILLMLSPPHPEQAQLGYRSSAFALQMARDWPTLTIILATPARDGFRLYTLVDFAFIAAYGALWLLMGWRFGERAWLKWIIGACVLGAVLCDVAENLATLRVLAVSSGYTNEMALDIRNWALTKWILLMFGWLTLAVALLTHRLPVVAVGYLFAAGIVATAYFTSTVVLELVAPVLAATLVVQAAFFIRSSGTARA